MFVANPKVCGAVCKNSSGLEKLYLAILTSEKLYIKFPELGRIMCKDPGGFEEL